MTVLTGEVVEYHTPEEWGAVIRADLGRSVGGIVDAGSHLRSAKQQLPHGEWEQWLRRELSMTRTHAFMLMALSDHKAISNVQYAEHLPASWYTLYELSHLDAASVEGAIAEGEITPALKQKDARQLVKRHQITDGHEQTPPKTLVGQFATIVADPPWRYGNTATRAAAEDHYPTMTIDELCALDFPRERAADDAHLYLWTTAGHLPEAFRVMEAWGFEYKTFLVWVKPQIGMGNYFRVSSELVLFGTRGSLPIEDRSIKNWFQAKRGKHSKKPESFYGLVQRASRGPYLEMFARCRRSQQLICGCARCAHGWDVWGNQT